MIFISASRNRSSSTPERATFGRRDGCRSGNSRANALRRVESKTLAVEELVNKFEFVGWE